MVEKLIKIPDKRYTKYNHPTCLRCEWTEETLDTLREAYHETHGQPGFNDAILHLNPQSADVQIFRRHPKLIRFSDDGTIMLKPNLGYVDMISLMEAPDSMREKPGGFALTGWFVHPTQLDGTVFADAENRRDFRKASESVVYCSNLEPVTDFARAQHQARIRDIERGSGIPYLASMFDLEAEHLPWLKELRRLTLEHLQEQYGVRRGDNVVMFFNSIIDEDTTTLHLHTLVNQGMHPLEYNHKSFYLDEVIGALEQGQTIEELVLSRPAYITTNRPDNRDFMSNLPGMRVTEIANPHIITSQYITVEPETDLFATPQSEGHSFVERTVRTHVVPSTQSSSSTYVGEAASTAAFEVGRTYSAAADIISDTTPESSATGNSTESHTPSPKHQKPRGGRSAV